MKLFSGEDNRTTMVQCPHLATSLSRATLEALPGKAERTHLVGWAEFSVFCVWTWLLHGPWKCPGKLLKVKGCSYWPGLPSLPMCLQQPYLLATLVLVGGIPSRSLGVRGSSDSEQQSLHYMAGRELFHMAPELAIR